MGEYLVGWEIQLDAESPQDAAWKALSIQRDPASIATVFGVTPLYSGARDAAKSVTVDIETRDEMPGSHVWLVHIEHRHGDELSVHRSEQSAWSEVYEWVATSWYSEYAVEGDLPTDHQEAISTYFEAMQEREWASVIKLKVYP